MPNKTHSGVADYLAHHIERSSKTQMQIAAEAGFLKSNIISMLKMGVTKLPLTRIPAIAIAIEANPVELFRLCMSEYTPDLLKVTDNIYGRDRVSDGERELLDRIRLQMGAKNFKLNTKTMAMIDGLAKELNSYETGPETERL